MEIPKNLVSTVAAFLAGTAITYYMHPVATSPPAPPVPTQISTETARNYFSFHRSEMEYGERGAHSKFGGYFDLTQDAIAEIQAAMAAQGFQRARLYFGQDRFPDPTSQMLLLNGINNGTEVNTGRLFMIRNSINSNTYCPKFCDFERSVLTY